MKNAAFVLVLSLAAPAVAVATFKGNGSSQMVMKTAVACFVL